MKKLIVALSVLAVACGSQAALLAYEGFDYAANTNAGEIQGLNGGTGFASGWVDSQDAAGDQEFRVVSPGDSWGTLDVTGNRLSREVTGGKEYLARTLSADLDAGPELWFSTLWNPSSNEGFAIASDPIDHDGSVPDWLVGKGGAGFGFANTDDTGCIASVWDSNGRTDGTSIALSGDQSLKFIVGQIQFNAADGSDVLNLYSVGTDLAQPAVGASVTADLDETLLDQVTFETNRGPGYDEIRVGTSYADVVSPIPEPATIGLLGVIGIGAALLRRLRS